MPRPTSVAGLVLACIIQAHAIPVAAHEFWLEPVVFMPKTGERVPVLHRIGQNFLGNSFPYVKAWFTRFAVIDAKGERAIKGREGDDPAAEVRLTQPGLNILVYQSAGDETTFETVAELEAYLKDEGLEAAGKAYRDAGKPAAKIRETYYRFAKSLMLAGKGSGNDRAVGMPVELVAETSPYALGPDKTMPVLLLHEGKPVAGATIKIFDTDHPKTHRRVVTDAAGRAIVALPNKDRFLLNAVVLRPPLAGETADLVSLWASLTFLRP